MLEARFKALLKQKGDSLKVNIVHRRGIVESRLVLTLLLLSVVQFFSAVTVLFFFVVFFLGFLTDFLTVLSAVFSEFDCSWASCSGCFN